MTSVKNCAFCGNKLKEKELYCPKCGTFDQSLTDEENRFSVIDPVTLDELEVYCREHLIPHQQIGFFVNEDILEPFANGIYADEGHFIVYENLPNGFRNIGYEGPDEEAAVKLFFSHMMDECHERGIHPERYTGKGDPTMLNNAAAGAIDHAPNPRYKSMIKLILIALAAAILILIVYLTILHDNDGYYSESGALYYKKGSAWYYYAGESWERYDADFDTFSPDFWGESYDPSWGAAEF